MRDAIRGVSVWSGQKVSRPNKEPSRRVGASSDFKVRILEPEPTHLHEMAEDLQGGIDDSFHSLSHSSSSFRIVDPGSELPARSRTISAPDTATWEHHHTSSSNSMMYGHSRSESFGRASQYDPHEGNAGHNLPTTVRPVSPQKSRTTPAPKEPLAAVLTATKYIPAPRMLPRVMKKEVWRELFLLSDGRDKAFVRSSLFLHY